MNGGDECDIITLNLDYFIHLANNDKSSELSIS